MVVNQGTSPVKPFAEGIEISNAEDWRKFIGLVNSRGGEQIYGVLKNDIELDDEDYNHGGTMSTAFSGGLDGQGHSIKLKNFKSALFFSTNNTTFKNLRITGSYTLSEQGAALVERSKNTTFENCQMDLTVIGETPYWAAFAFTNMEGRASTYGVDHGNSTTTFKNCLVTNDYSQLTFGWPYGFIVCGAANLAFRGIYKSNQIQFDHVVYAPKSPHGRYDQAISSDWNPGNAHFSTLYVAKKSTDVEEYDTNYKFLPENKDEALTLLGTGWYASESWPYVTPIHVADGTKDSEFEFLINAPKFYFAPNGKVKENSLIADTRQSSVMLTWEVEGGAIDYFQVLRREIGKEEWKIIAPDVIELGFICSWLPRPCSFRNRALGSWRRRQDWQALLFG